MIRFDIPGPPVGKARPRVTRSGHAHTPAKTRTAEAFVKLMADQAMRGLARLDGPVSARIDVTLEPPASWSKRNRNLALAGILRPTSKPDLDNLAKLILDACNGVVWRDDKQVVELVLSKRYGAGDRTTVTIMAQSDDDGAERQYGREAA